MELRVQWPAAPPFVGGLEYLGLTLSDVDIRLHRQLSGALKTLQLDVRLAR